MDTGLDTGAWSLRRLAGSSFHRNLQHNKLKATMTSNFMSPNKALFAQMADCTTNGIIYVTSYLDLVKISWPAGQLPRLKKT